MGDDQMHGVSEGARPLGAHPDCRDMTRGWCGWPSGPSQNWSPSRA